MNTIKHLFSIRTLGIAGAFVLGSLNPSTPCQAQVTVTTGYTAANLVNRLNGTGVVVFGETLTCGPESYGEFTASGTTLGFGSGIVLTNGTAMTSGSNVGIDGPASNFASTSIGSAGDSDLTLIAGGPTYDACILQFSFVPSGDTISFDYVFGSEEYTSYTCSPFNDVFGFFISGGSYTTPYNMARVPGTNIPVCINSINCGASAGYTLSTCSALGAGAPFCDYYINNTTGSYITYDGLTTTLTAKAGVNPLDTYSLKIGVADVTDHILDSGVLLATGSLRSAPPTHSKVVLTAGDIHIFPNPVRNVLELEGTENYSAFITDLTGNVVLSSEVLSGNAQKISLTQLSKGIYLLKLTNTVSGTTVTKRFVKE